MFIWRVNSGKMEMITLKGIVTSIYYKLSIAIHSLLLLLLGQ